MSSFEIDETSLEEATVHVHRSHEFTTETTTTAYVDNRRYEEDSEDEIEEHPMGEKVDEHIEEHSQSPTSNEHTGELDTVSKEDRSQGTHIKAEDSTEDGDYDENEIRPIKTHHHRHHHGETFDGQERHENEIHRILETIPEPESDREEETNEIDNRIHKSQEIEKSEENNEIDNEIQPFPKPTILEVSEISEGEDEEEEEEEEEENGYGITHHGHEVVPELVDEVKPAKNSEEIESVSTSSPPLPSPTSKYKFPDYEEYDETETEDNDDESEEEENPVETVEEPTSTSLPSVNCPDGLKPDQHGKCVGKSFCLCLPSLFRLY